MNCFRIFAISTREIPFFYGTAFTYVEMNNKCSPVLEKPNIISNKLTISNILCMNDQKVLK